MAPLINNMKGSRLFGIAKEMQNDMLGTIQAHCDFCEQHDLPGLSLSLGIVGSFDLILDPASIACILQDPENIFHKSYIDKASMAPPMGNGISLANGDEHTQKK